MIKQKLIDNDPSSIAEFLLTTPGLSKFAIGQYIGLKDPNSLEVLREFTNKIEFIGMEVDEAMRLYLQ